MHHNQGFDWDPDDFNEFDMVTAGGSRQNNYDVVPQMNVSSTMNSVGDKKKISDAQIYGPRFCAIYEQYRQKQNAPIDIRRHLMSLCVEHMISFINWARESDQQVNMISSILLENDYLRPEVRNGVVMVLIYTFASIKSTATENMDMFTTLQDPENGLGIANKFSLKIYNDPFNYLIFLKLSISALIDAGVIPDNERLSQQPKKSGPGGSMVSSNNSVMTTTTGKTQYTNREEYDSFLILATRLVAMLDAGKNQEARNFVTQITNFWQMRGKYVRNRKFTCALQALTSTATVSNLEVPLDMNMTGQDNSSSSNPIPATVPVPVATIPPPKSNTKGGNKRSAQELPRDENQEDVTMVQPPNKKAVKTTIPVVAAVTTPQAPASIPQLHILRFERTGHTQWDIQESRIFDLSSFLNMLQASTQQTGEIGNVYLVNEGVLSPAIQSKQWKVDGSGTQAGGGIHLAQEIKESVITSWLQPTEFLQLSSFLATYAQHSVIAITATNTSPLSLYDIWMGNAANSNAGMVAMRNNTQKVQGYLAYEIESYIIFIIRKNPSLGIVGDIWCRIYPTEMNSPFQQAEEGSKEISIGEYLLHFFPQLHQLKKRLKILSKKLQATSGDDSMEYDENDIMLKYYQHKVGTTTTTAAAEANTTTASATNSAVDTGGGIRLPAMLSVASYQTVGTYTTVAKKIISRLTYGSMIIHDFCLEVVEY